jgi:probable rRNA maturation factor
MDKSYCKKTHINVQNLTRSRIDREFVKKIAQGILKKEKKQGDISIIFVGEKKIRDLNKRYRKQDKVTDVLSFSQDLVDTRFKDIFELGEIVVCLIRVKKDAQELKSDFEKELKWVIIHGILHVLGYDHKKLEKEAKRMKKKEEYYLKNL